MESEHKENQRNEERVLKRNDTLNLDILNTKASNSVPKLRPNISFIMINVNELNPPNIRPIFYKLVRESLKIK